MQKRSFIQYAATAVAVTVLSIAGGFIGSRLGRPAEQESIQIGAPPSAPATAVRFESGTSAEVARAFQERFRAVADETLQVVVEINVLNRVQRRTGTNPLDFFFGTPRNNEDDREFLQQGMGSGVIIAKEGDTVYVLTNDHVVGDAAEIEINLSDGRSFDGDVVGTDELMDIALVSFETRDDVPLATLGDSDSLRAGDWVFAVGNPLGFESTVTAGIVSATGRLASDNSQLSGLTDYIQTDAAINRGNSGGALVNLDGEVVGINTWIASQTGGSIGLGFAIPVNNARRVVTDLLQSGEVTYSWLGVSVATVDDEFAERMGFDAERGAFVSGVYEQSPAEESGLLPGDIVIRIGERQIPDSSTLVQVVGTLRPGEPTEFEIVRGGRQLTLSVTTARRTEESFVSSAVWPGLTVAPITDAAREELELGRRTNGVIVGQVQRGTPAADSGIRPADVIVAVNGENVTSPANFYAQLGETADNEIQFRIIREGRTLILGFVRSST